MRWPWISGPETELVSKLGFRLSRTFLWSPMLIKAPQHSGGELRVCSLLYKNLFQQTLCPPSPKGISPGLVETGTEHYFRPWDHFACPLEVPSPKQ